MQLCTASEIWISSSTREMVPVTQLDGQPVGSGEMGPVFKQAWQWYRSFRGQFSR
jgi:D-alanine transaminase